jgi:hypothetical protein
MPSFGIWLQPPAHAGSSLADVSTLKMEAIHSYEMSVQPRSTWYHIPEDSILHSHHHENLKSYKGTGTAQNTLNCLHWHQYGSDSIIATCGFQGWTVSTHTLFLQKQLIHVPECPQSLGTRRHEIKYTLLSKKYSTLFFAAVSNGQRGEETERGGRRDFHAHV